MAFDAGNYDWEASRLQRELKADTVVLIVVNGKKGTAMSVATRSLPGTVVNVEDPRHRADRAREQKSPEAVRPVPPALPATGFLRISQIVKHPGNPFPLIPISRSSWLKGVAEGRYPQPLKLGRSTLWRVEDVRKLIEGL